MRLTKFAYLGAAAFAVLVGVAVYLVQISAGDRLADSETSVAVLVATANIDAGITIAEAERRHLIGVEHFPLSAIPKDVVRAHSSMVRKFYAAVPAGQLILQRVLRKPPAEVALPIPNGKVAITINLDDASRVAGYAQAGNWVAIYFGKNQARIAAPQLLIPRAQILALGNQAANLAPTLVTFALAPADAVRLIAANRSGYLTLTLLGIGSAQ